MICRDDFSAVLREIEILRRERKCIFIAIDGRCASGKSTLAAMLKDELGCNVFHMDDFFLRPEQRTPERYAQPGGNVDRERFFSEVLTPLMNGKHFSYCPFDCHSMTLGEPIDVEPADIAVIEGTYCCHPELIQCYDLRVFITTSPQKQLDRIAERNRGAVDVFKSKWIPLEEKYFSAYDIEKRCEIIIET